jgi:streptogrisin C
MRTRDLCTGAVGGRHHRFLLGPVVLLLVGVVAGQATAVAAAADAAELPPYLADATEPAVTTLASDLGISIREAQRRIGWQEPAMQLGEELRQALGDRFGGLWFDEAGGGRVKVGVVGGDHAGTGPLIARYKLTAVTDLVAVRYSYAELEQASAWLGRAIAKANRGAASGLGSALLVDKNLVELSLPRGQRLNATQQATVGEVQRRLGARLTVGSWSGQMRGLTCVWVVGVSLHCDPPLRGGVGLYRYVFWDGAWQWKPWCTAAFNARSISDNKWYLLTAGHCGGEGTEFRELQPRTGLLHLVGHLHNASPPVQAMGDDDYSIVTIDNVSGWDPKPYVYVHDSIDTIYNPTYRITGVEGSGIGQRVCFSGQISGSDCGKVEKLGVGGAGGYAQVDLCAKHGDSGSPIYSLGKARGILVATIDDTVPCQDILYQGLIEAVQELNVYVVTG